MKGDWTNVVKVQCTPDSKLRGEVQKVLDRNPGPDGGRTKVLEATGVPVHCGVKQNPFLTNKCEYNQKCMSTDRTNCCRANVVYRVECELCKEQGTKSLYTGTTGCTLHKRMIEHNAAIGRNDQKNALAKHMLASHQGEEAKFSTTILDQQKYNMQRYIAESLHIEVTTNDRETKG